MLWDDFYIYLQKTPNGSLLLYHYAMGTFWLQCSKPKTKPKRSKKNTILYLCFYIDLYRVANKNEGANLVTFLFQFFSLILLQLKQKGGGKKNIYMFQFWGIYFQSSVAYHTGEGSQLPLTLYILCRETVGTECRKSTLLFIKAYDSL